LDVSANKIHEISEIQLLGTCNQLKTLHLDGNPISKVDSYREIVLHFIPSLVSLDGHSSSKGSPTKKKGRKQQQGPLNNNNNHQQQPPTVVTEAIILSAQESLLLMDEEAEDEARMEEELMKDLMLMTGCSDSYHTTTMDGFSSPLKQHNSSSHCESGLTHGCDEVMAGNLVLGLMRRRRGTSSSSNKQHQPSSKEQEEEEEFKGLEEPCLVGWMEELKDSFYSDSQMMKDNIRNTEEELEEKVIEGTNETNETTNGDEIGEIFLPFKIPSKDNSGYDEEILLDDDDEDINIADEEEEEKREISTPPSSFENRRELNRASSRLVLPYPSSSSSSDGSDNDQDDNQEDDEENELIKNGKFVSPFNKRMVPSASLGFDLGSSLKAIDRWVEEDEEEEEEDEIIHHSNFQTLLKHPTTPTPTKVVEMNKGPEEDVNSRSPSPLKCEIIQTTTRMMTDDRSSPSPSKHKGEAFYMSDADLIDLLSKSPKEVPQIKTKSVIRIRFFC